MRITGIARSALLLALVLVLASCVSVARHYSSAEFEIPDDGYRLIIMPPDVTAGVATAFGTFEPREDWTAMARAHVLDAVVADRAQRGGETIVASAENYEAASVESLVQLHRAVGQALLTHKHSGPKLPTKKAAFDWTLGESAVRFGAESRGDYALFLTANDYFTSIARLGVLVAASALACAGGVSCFVPVGASQDAFASLVDLKSGDVVWFGVYESGRGDIRKSKGAANLVDQLFASMYSASEDRAKRAR